MSRSSLQYTSLFHSVEDELKYWKMSYYELDKKYQRLLLCHTCTTKYRDQEPAAKRPRIEENNMDPIVKLPEPCVHKIMGYLSAKELLRATEVSKAWKQFIETRNSLMNQSMSNIVAKLDITNYSLPLINNIFGDDSQKRPYKHMKGSLRQYQNYTYTKTVFPITLYASTLETLSTGFYEHGFYDYGRIGIFKTLVEANDESYQIAAKGHFPMLKKLQTNLDASTWIRLSSFPELTHLSISFRQANFDFEGYSCEVFTKMLQSCPKLKYLFVDRIQSVLPNDLTDPINDPIQNEMQHPKIEGISLAEYHPKFLRDQKNSLKKLYVRSMSKKEISWCLRDLKLKSLTIRFFELEGEENFQPNYSVETLKIRDEFAFEVEDEVRLQNIQRLLLALPSLKELIYGDNTYTTDLIPFIANNMRHLKKLICPWINKEMTRAHKEVQRNPHRYINSTFELIADRKHKYNEIAKEFGKLFRQF